jgi:hypothetical protein
LYWLSLSSLLSTSVFFSCLVFSSSVCLSVRLSVRLSSVVLLSPQSVSLSVRLSVHLFVCWLCWLQFTDVLCVVLQVITDTQWSLYVLKYATKCEPTGNINLDADAARALGLRGLSELQLKLASATVLSRPLGPAESALILLGISLIQLSQSISHISCVPPVMRTRFSSTDQISVPWVERYIARMAVHAPLTFVEYFSTYLLVPPRDPCPKKCQEVGRDRLLWRVCKPLSLTVRFSNFNPTKQPEAFFYYVLLHHVAFAREADLDPVGEEKSYFDVCKR